jgi:hypothetical protein
MLCIEGVLAQTHTPEESIVVRCDCIHLTRITISKRHVCNNPHSGDFFYKAILTQLAFDHNVDQSVEQVMQAAQGCAHLPDAVL